MAHIFNIGRVGGNTHLPIFWIILLTKAKNTFSFLPAVTSLSKLNNRDTERKYSSHFIIH